MAERTPPARRAHPSSDRNAVAPRRQGRPADTDSAETRRRILAAATVCFGQLGYDRTTNQMIAKGAGLTAGTLYHYFDSKAVIYRAVGDEIQQNLEARVRAELDPELPAKQQVAIMLSRLATWVRERPDVAAFIVTSAAELQHRGDVLRLSRTTWWTKPQDFYQRIATVGHERGELARDVSPAAFGGLVQGLVYGLLAFIGVSRDAEVTEEVMSAFVRLTLGDIFRDA